MKKELEISRRSQKIHDKRDYCVYCSKDVTNFSRHIVRNHSNEDSVQLILKEPIGSETRKSMIASLRKEGNFLLLEEKNCIRPKQREKSQSSNIISRFVACPECKGIYRQKTLWRHVNYHCQVAKSKKKSGSSRNLVSEGHNLVIFKSALDKFAQKLRLRSEVLVKMRGDSISFAGKSDPIILQYADDYYSKFTKEKRATRVIKNCVSNKIREMGRLLLIIQESFNIRTMIKVLNPIHYDKVMHAVRVMSGFDGDKQKFEASSLASQMGTKSKAICVAAKTSLLKKEAVLAVKDFTTVDGI